MSEHFDMDLTYKKTPAKRLIRMPRNRAEAIRAAIEAVAKDPFGHHPNLKPLQGMKNGFRLRVGERRVSMTIDRDTGTVEVFEIEPRGSAYR
ncbi:type II toxin-antitoxin system RelE/ParE family toxin [Pelagibius sp.]|uniref:type II toxin-antitoxin system RelE family toxin n=1 Tax=Pelagibius sp. TaxID=1931238 RepID=UPI0026269090|nr:type II toxin-antitoxin system RelE/ParE family toxin [Pelagibius sp.]